MLQGMRLFISGRYAHGFEIVSVLAQLALMLSYAFPHLPA
jgi:hypothetical protein